MASATCAVASPPSACAVRAFNSGVSAAGRTDAVMSVAAIDAGAEDVESDEDGHQVWTAQEDLHGVARALEDSLGTPESVKLAWRPGTRVEVGADDAGQLMK